MEEAKDSFRAAIIGGSGAVGREIIQLLDEDDNFSKVTIITRRRIDEWNKLKNVEKFEFLDVESLDELLTMDKDLFRSYDTFFCTLGSRTKYGKEIFFKVDYTYPLQFCEFAKSCGVPHYSVLSASGGKPKSWFYYFKVKGLMEEAVKNVGMEMVSIFKPGLITQRRNDSRFVEKIGKVIPFVSKCSAIRIAQTMILDAEIFHKVKRKFNVQNGCRVFQNKEIKKPNF